METAILSASPLIVIGAVFAFAFVLACPSVPRPIRASSPLTDDKLAEIRKQAAQQLNAAIEAAIASGR
jgi:hypothetical protein